MSTKVKEEFADFKEENQNPYIEEELMTQWPKEKVQKDKQRSTKHTHKTTDRVMRKSVRRFTHYTYLYFVSMAILEHPVLYNLLFKMFIYTLYIVSGLYVIFIIFLFIYLDFVAMLNRLLILDCFDLFNHY